MKSYIISGLALSQIKSIAEANLRFHPWNQNGDDVLIEENTLPTVLSLLNATVLKEEQTDYEGLLSLTLAFREPLKRRTKQGHSISISTDWNGANPHAALDMIEEFLAPSIEANIVLHVPHGEARAPITDGDFHILIWSSPLGSKAIKPPEYIFGTKVDCRDSAFLPSGTGISLIDPENGFTCAEIVGNNLYIHHDLVHHGSKSESELFCRIIEDFHSERCLDPSEREEKKRQRLKARTAAARDRYINFCEARVQSLIAVANNQAARERQKLESTEQGFFNSAQKLSLFQYLSEGKTISTDLSLHLGSQIKEIALMPAIKNVELRDGFILVRTFPLSATDRSLERRVKSDMSAERINIGEFLILVSLVADRCPIRFINCTKRTTGAFSGMHSPYILADGIPVSTELRETFCDLIAQFEFSTAIEIAIQFIETIDSIDSFGVYSSAWQEQQ